MEGAALRAARDHDNATAQAWHTAMFVLQGYSGQLKGKKLSDFLSSPKTTSRGNSGAQGIAFFHRIKAAGIAVEITRH